MTDIERPHVGDVVVRRWGPMAGTKGVVIAYLPPGSPSTNGSYESTERVEVNWYSGIQMCTTIATRSLKITRGPYY